MTINLANNNPRISYSVAQGATQQTFAVPFEFFNDSDITVYVDGVLKTEGSDYTLTGGDGSTGNVVFVTATPPAVQQVLGATGGSTVVIFRTTDIERTSDFSAGSDINRAALNEQLDILTAMIADQNDKTDRTIRLNDYETAPSLILPSIANRKGKVLAFNATTGAVEQGPSVSSVDTVANSAADIQTVADNIGVILASPANASAAAASASAASGSASAASGSASAASSSASAAASSASTAATLLDSFDDRYLGPKASAPSVDNDGNTLLVGALYWNTTSNNLFVWSGSAWNAGALDTGSLGNMSTQNSNAVSITGGSITGITDLAVADGGTGASTLTGYVKGTGTAALTASSTIPSTDITGLGTMAAQSASSVAITGGSITGITDLAVADGGTGASTGAGALTNFGLTATVAQLNFVAGVTSSIQTQLDAKAALASPALTGTPTAPTAATGTNTTQLATTAFALANSTGKTLLGTLTMTSGSSQTLSSLVLTSYKQLVFEFFNVGHSSGSNQTYSIGTGIVLTGVTPSDFAWGMVTVSLVSGIASPILVRGNSIPRGVDTNNQVAQTGYSTATTSVSVSVSGGTFDSGTVTIYGVK